MEWYCCASSPYGMERKETVESDVMPSVADTDSVDGGTHAGRCPRTLLCNMS